jgi:hypothetical protein
MKTGALFGRRQEMAARSLHDSPAATSPPFPYDCSSPANTTNALLEPLMTRPSAVSPPAASFPPWLTALCPEVVAHFTAFPYFARPHPTIPTMTSVQGAHLVCTLKIMADIGGRIGADVMLYAGSLIGALRHGGPVPWDDDADLALPFSAMPAFLAQCRALEHALHPDITVHCRQHSVFVKVYVEDKCGSAGDCGAQVSRPTPKPWRWPYADVFMYRTTVTHWQESTLSGEESPRKHSFPLEAVFPSQRYYFGGVSLPGPRAEYADTAYPSWTACHTSNFDHRQEVWASGDVADMQLNCCEAARWLPFATGGGRAGRRSAGPEGPRVEILAAREARVSRRRVQ